MNHPHDKHGIPRRYPTWDTTYTVLNFWPPGSQTMFWPFDFWGPQWPLTSTKKKWNYLLNMANPHTKYEISQTYPSWDTVFTSNFQGFYHLTSSDLKWPLTPTKIYRDHLLYKANPHTKYDISNIYPSWDIVFTSKSVTYTHTHTRHHHRIDSLPAFGKESKRPHQFLWGLSSF